MKRSRFASLLVLATAVTILGPMSSMAAAAPGASGVTNSAAATSEPAASYPEPGTVDAKPEKPRGRTEYVPVDEKSKKPKGVARNVESTTIQPTANYCGGQLVYVPVRNVSTSHQNIQVVLHNQGYTRDYFTTVAPSATGYVPFYGTFGSYIAYLYVYNPGTRTYIFDEFRVSNNACYINVTAACNLATGVVNVAIKNNGTAIATMSTARLAPGPYAQWTDISYPGTTIMRAVPVRSAGGSPVSYGITSDPVGAMYDHFTFVGVC
jgi:hypothetical protein